MNIYLSLLHFNVNIIFFFYSYGELSNRDTDVKVTLYVKFYMGCINIVFVLDKSSTMRITEFMRIFLAAFKTYGRDIEEGNEV